MIPTTRSNTPEVMMPTIAILRKRPFNPIIDNINPTIASVMLHIWKRESIIQATIPAIKPIIPMISLFLLGIDVVDLSFMIDSLIVD